MAIKPAAKQERDLFSDRSGTKKKNEILALLLFAVAIIILVSIMTFDYKDLSHFSSSPNKPLKNFGGIVGAYIGCAAVMLMGMSAYIIPVLIGLWATAELAGNRFQNFFVKFFGTVFLILASSSTFSLLTKYNSDLSFTTGGILGTSFSNFLIKYLGVVGAFVAILVLLLLSVLIATDFLVFPIIIALFKATQQRVKGIPASLPIFKTPKEKAKETAAASKPLIKTFRDSTAQGAKARVGSMIARAANARPAQQVPKKPVLEPKTSASAGEPSEPVKETKILRGPSVDQADVPVTSTEASVLASDSTVSPKPREEEAKPYKLPTLDLLKTPPPNEKGDIKEDLTENSRILEEILNDFDIAAKVIEVNQGPVITRYELEPGVGVKIHRITSLADNIALAMKAESIRIVAPVPGKGTVGVEIPNLKRMMVFLRETLETKEYKDERSKLKLALGKDIAGAPVVADLGAMPHLLIAGATGSGKTVCVNSIISSLLFNATPEEVRFIMVDPKKVELAPFNNIPHLLCPVVTDYKKVPIALDWLVHEMEKRYELFASCGVRNIDFYNKKADQESWQPLYYIVVIIDELADLMMVAQAEIESAITRLAQLSRAVGIHMILATQRPSVNVITGVIKANFPARISFKVASMVDSRTVIDTNGAEKLLGRGDMLVLEPGSDRAVRAQGGLVFDEEIERVIEFIKSQREPDYVEEMMKVPKRGQGGAKFHKDEIYEEAVKLVVENKQASVSLLQRKLGVGYTKAARLIDMMEDEGIVGPYQGSKPREVLVENTSQLNNGENNE